MQITVVPSNGSLTTSIALIITLTFLLYLKKDDGVWEYIRNRYKGKKYEVEWVKVWRKKKKPSHTREKAFHKEEPCRAYRQYHDALCRFIDT